MNKNMNQSMYYLLNDLLQNLNGKRYHIFAGRGEQFVLYCVFNACLRGNITAEYLITDICSVQFLEAIQKTISHLISSVSTVEIVFIGLTV